MINIGSFRHVESHHVASCCFMSCCNLLLCAQNNMKKCNDSSSMDLVCCSCNMLRCAEHLHFVYSSMKGSHGSSSIALVCGSRIFMHRIPSLPSEHETICILPYGKKQWRQLHGLVVRQLPCSDECWFLVPPGSFIAPMLTHTHRDDTTPQTEVMRQLFLLFFKLLCTRCRIGKLGPSTQPLTTAMDVQCVLPG